MAHFLKKKLKLFRAGWLSSGQCACLLSTPRSNPAEKNKKRPVLAHFKKLLQVGKELSFGVKSSIYLFFLYLSSASAACDEKMMSTFPITPMPHKEAQYLYLGHLLITDHWGEREADGWA